MPSERILLPATLSFMAISLGSAYLLNMLPWGHYLGVPNWFAIVLLFWSIHEPRRISMGIAFILGIILDVHEGNLLGEHALVYIVLSYLGNTLQRRIIQYPLWLQPIFIFPILFLSQLTATIMQLLTKQHGQDWLYLSSSLIGAIIWPAASALLSIHLKRIVDADDIRPI